MKKTAKIHFTSDIKISDAIIDNPYLLLLIEHFRIAMPLNDKTIEKVCEENHLNSGLFLTIADLYNGVQCSSELPFSFDDTNTIITFLQSSHKFYLDEIYPDILVNIKQIAEVNDSREVALVQKFFVDYFSEVTEHLDYEDKVVFPYVLDLYGQIKDMPHPRKETKYSVKEYKRHHGDIEEKLNDLKNLLVKYLPQKNDQAIRRKLLLNLSELEFDLNIHSNIEDLILIPLVTKMELHLKKSN